MKLRLIYEWGVSEQDVTPDDVLSDDEESIPFIYNPDYSMFYGSREGLHWSLLAKYFNYYNNDIDIDSIYGIERGKLISNLRQTIQDISLIGRAGPNLNIVAFWNENKSVYKKLLNSCLERLENDGLINENALVSTPHFQMNMSEVLGQGIETKEMSPEEKHRLELQQQLHLMSPKLKKQAMKELGLIGGGRKREMQKKAEKTGLVSPGQKWWAMTSESSN